MLIVLAVVFHRPLLIAALRTTAIEMAIRQNVQLSLQIEGNVLNGLTLKNLQAIPVGSSPVESIKIERLQVQYSLRELFRNGVRNFVKGYDLRNATLALTATKGTQDQRQALANILRDILQQPALFSDRAQVENFNLTVKTAGGAWVVGGLDAHLDPLIPGFVRVAELTVPKIGTWRNVQSAATYIDRHLVTHDFRLGNEVAVTRLELDASQHARGVNYLSFEGKVLGGEVALFLWRREVKGDTSYAQLTASVKHLPLAALHDFLRWRPEIKGKVSRGWIQLSGNPAVPSGWEGSSSVQVEDGSVNGVRVEHAASTVIVSQGLARLDSAQFATGNNRLVIRAERKLPDTFDKLLTENLSGTAELEAPELRQLHPAITTGSMHGSGHFKIEAKEFTGTFDTSADSVSGKQVALKNGDATLRLSVAIGPRTPEMPWFEGVRAHIDGRLGSLRLGAYELDTGAFAGQVQEGLLRVDSAEFHRGPNTIQCKAEYDLPTLRRNRVFSWADAVGSLRFNLDAPSLAAFAAAPNVSGTRALGGATKATGDLRHSAGILNGRLKVEASELRFQEFTARQFKVEVPIENNTAQIRDFQLDLNGKDRLAGDGSIGLVAPFSYNGSLSGTLQNLNTFQPLLKTPIAGSLQIDWHGAGQLQTLQHSGEGQATVRQGRFGDFTGIDGEIAGTYSPEKIELGTFRVRSDQGSVKAGVRMHDQRLKIDQLLVQIGTSTVKGSFNLPLDLRTPDRPETVFPESGALEGTLTLEQIDLAAMFPARSGTAGQRSVGVPPKVFGTNEIHSQKLPFSAKGATHTSLGQRPRFSIQKDQGLKARAIDSRPEMEQAFSPDPSPRPSWGDAPGWYGTDLRSSAKATPNTTSVPPAADGVRGRDTHAPLAIAEMIRGSGTRPILPGDFAPKGLLNATLKAEGTLAAPDLTVTAQARNLQLRAAEKLPPATANATLIFRNKRLALDGAFSLPGISPLRFAGNLPLDVKRTLTDRQLDPATPITFSIKLPSSPASLLAQVFPIVRYVEGRISVDASGAGTLANPVLTGGMALDLPAIRFQNENLPGLGNFRGELRFAKNELVLQRFAGEVSGGPFAVGGRIRLEPWTNPQLELHLKSEDILLVRNDTLTLRANSDLKIIGPLDSAHVTGKLGIIKSRFFREVEILPLGLPGSPAPKVAQGRPNFSTDVAPFRNWTFDVAITTKEPFVIRSNLASGRAVANLHLGGNGLAPIMEGTAHFENLAASLPFSRLDVDYGNLYLTPDNPFNPVLDIHGTSRIRDYSISVYIYGTASEPQTLFTSEPPLPQEELIALIATGATTKEFTENNQVIASRAGVLLLQDVYRKIFKRRTPAQETPTSQVIDRFKLDVGTVDPRTGKQELGGRFKLSDQYEVGAGVDIQGDVRLQFRYLLKFR